MGVGEVRRECWGVVVHSFLWRRRWWDCVLVVERKGREVQRQGSKQNDSSVSSNTQFECGEDVWRGRRVDRQGKWLKGFGLDVGFGEIWAWG